MTQRIAIVTTEGDGGVKIAIQKLHRGLRLSGIDSQLLIPGKGLGRAIYEDFKSIRRLEDFDVLLYMNSTPLPDYLFTKKSIKGIFVHGFINQELMNEIRHRNMLRKFRAAAQVIYRSILKWSYFSPNFTIFQSETAREANSVTGNYVILPQYVLPEEVHYYRDASSSIGHNRSKTIQILTYLSSVDSPRLLGTEDIIKFAQTLDSLTNREFQVNVVTSRSPTVTNTKVKFWSYVPRPQFLNLLSETDLYIERCVDEELGYTSIEAGLLGIPVAKMMKQSSVYKADYRTDQVVYATNMDALAREVAEYVNRIDYYRPIFSQNIRNFLTTDRAWRNVSGSLIDKLKSFE